ncbi:hypothetical protein ACIBM4_05875 [Streptomyces sp. NPDC050256]|uniref:hypothetical protein n=1 Tax=Streptomyces sp. NPDC050256 TaxID=3365607 RepID=UPI0037A205AA
MHSFTAAPHTVPGAAARAGVFTVLSSAIAAGLHHATADSAVSWPGLALAAVGMFLGAVPAFLLGSPRAVMAIVIMVQAALPTWLNGVESAVAPGGHHQLPPVWHHSSPLMVLLNIAVALALAWLLNGARALSAQLLHTCAAPARQFTALLARLRTLFVPQPHAPPLPACRAFALRAGALSFQTAHLTLRHQRVPCGP